MVSWFSNYLQQIKSATQISLETILNNNTAVDKIQRDHLASMLFSSYQLRYYKEFKQNEQTDGMLLLSLCTLQLTPVARRPNRLQHQSACRAIPMPNK
jgi:hypothetical protein